MLHQRARKLTTAKHQNVLARLLFQLSDLFRDIALEQGSIPLSGCCLLHDAATGGRVAITMAIAIIGRTAGPPWAADRRHAAAAAWLALS